MDYVAVAQHCAPRIDTALVVRLVRRESGFNAFAIGLDGRAVLKPQPTSFDAAVQAAERLIQQGVKFSAGPAQLHIDNIRRLGLTWRQVFHPCTNISIGEGIFLDFHRKALAAGYRGDEAVYAALRGYNSGNINAAISNNYASAILARPRPSMASSAPRLQPAPVSQAVTHQDESKEFFDEP